MYISVHYWMHVVCGIHANTTCAFDANFTAKLVRVRNVLSAVKQANL